jgi:sodium-dependent dicarboxylate transporter 2/3/5
VWVGWSERRFTINWNEAARIDWGTVILFGCGIALGTLLSDTGLAEIIGNGIADTFGFTSLAAVSALIAIIISETTSNTASATIVVPIVVPIANAAGLDPLVPALAAVYGSGMIPITKMVRSGIAFDITGLLLIVLLIPVMAGLILA